MAETVLRFRYADWQVAKALLFVGVNLLLCSLRNLNSIASVHFLHDSFDSGLDVPVEIIRELKILARGLSIASPYDSLTEVLGTFTTLWEMRSRDGIRSACGKGFITDNLDLRVSVSVELGHCQYR